MVFCFEHAEYGHGDPTLSMLGVVMVIHFEHAWCGHGAPTLSMLGVVMVIPLAFRTDFKIAHFFWILLEAWFLQFY